jgi:hypothetical protein
MDIDTFRIEFNAETTESQAKTMMDGLNGGNASMLRTATIAGVVTGWCDVPVDDINHVCDELDEDDRVVAYA